MMLRTTAAVLRTSADPEVVGPAAFDGLRVEEVALSGPCAGEVLIDVHTASICHSDLSVLTGARPRPLPMVLGHEASGVVSVVGAEVHGLEVGQPVIMTFVPACGNCRSCREGRPALCEPGNAANSIGALITGRRPFADAAGAALHQHLGVSAFSRQTVVAAESVVPLPDSVPLDVAALFGCAVLTGVGAVFNTAAMRPGATVAIFGCGGVGLAALLGAHAGGAARIVAVDTRAHKLEQAKALGADDTVMASSESADQIRAQTAGGVDFAFEATGSITALEQAYAATRRGGAVVVIGLASPDARLEVSPTDLVASERRILGSYMGSTVPARDVPLMIDLYKRGRLPVESLVTERIGLDDVPAGTARLNDGVLGRQLVEM